MYATASDEWDVHIRVSGRRIFVADLYDSGISSAPTISSLPISEFSVVADRRAAHRRTGSLTVVNDVLLSEFKNNINTSTFSPYGSEIRIYSGVTLSDSSQELVPLGVFQIDSLEWSDDNSEMRLQLVDRSKLLQRAEFHFPYSPAGTSVIEAIEYLLESIIPWVTLDFSLELEDFNIPGGTTYSGDYLDAIRSLASLIGADFFFDSSGNPRLVPVPYIPAGAQESDAVWQISAGAFGVLISTDSSISRNDTYNEVIVTGASTSEAGPQPYYVARDIDPTSRTYIEGGFGRSTLRVERQELLTQDRCRLVAETTLNNVLGLSRNVSLSSVSNPALEEGDVVLVEYLDGTSELQLVDSISFDESGSSNISTRAKRV